jgi:hypothetical protein
VLWAVKEKAKPGRKLAKRQQARNRHFGKVWTCPGFVER